jgi:hypothetical protein
MIVAVECWSVSLKNQEYDKRSWRSISQLMRIGFMIALPCRMARRGHSLFSFHRLGIEQSSLFRTALGQACTLDGHFSD